MRGGEGEEGNGYWYNVDGMEGGRKKVLVTPPLSLQTVQCEQEEDHSTAHL